MRKTHMLIYVSGTDVETHGYAVTQNPCYAFGKKSQRVTFAASISLISCNSWWWHVWWWLRRNAMQGKMRKLLSVLRFMMQAEVGGHYLFFQLTWSHTGITGELLIWFDFGTSSLFLLALVRLLHDREWHLIQQRIRSTMAVAVFLWRIHCDILHWTPSPATAKAWRGGVIWGDQGS